MIALSCWPFDLAPFNELYGGKLMCSITLIPFEILWWYLVNMYIRSRRCVVCKNDCSPLLAFWLSSLEGTLWGKACVLNDFHTIWDILIIFGRHVYKTKTVCHVQEWLLSLFGLLSYLPWMNFMWEITVILFEIFWRYLVYMYIRSRRCASCKNGCSCLVAF